METIYGFTAEVFYNVGMGAMMDFNPETDALRHVATLTVYARSPESACEKVWQEMNRGSLEGQEYISTEGLEVRSMCMGDVVRLSAVHSFPQTWVVDVVGFKKVNPVAVRRATKRPIDPRWEGRGPWS